MYLGLSAFNARARAINFSPDELPEVTLLVLRWISKKASLPHIMCLQKTWFLSWCFEHIWHTHL